MNRLVLVPCIVVASYVAFALYVASYVVHEFTRSRVELISTYVANLEEIHKDSNSPTKQTRSGHPSYSYEQPGSDNRKTYSFGFACALP